MYDHSIQVSFIEQTRFHLLSSSGSIFNSQLVRHLKNSRSAICTPYYPRQILSKLKNKACFDLHYFLDEQGDSLAKCGRLLSKL